MSLRSQDYAELSEHGYQENDEMKWSQVAAAATLSASMMTACADEPTRPEFKLNPHPQELYEITVTIGPDAPGPLVVLDGGAIYHAPGCSYTVNRLAGAHGKPQWGLLIAYTQVNDTTYVGTAYLDAMLDEDYDGPDGGSPQCHWQSDGVGAHLKATGAAGETAFLPSMSAEEVRAEKSVTTYFNKIGYPRHPDLVNFRSYGRTDRAGMALLDSQLFTITLTAKKVQP